MPGFPVRTLGLAAAGLLAMAAPAAASPSSCPVGESSGAVNYRFGGLAEAVLRLPVPVERVRHLVPPSYRLLDEQTGMATLLAAHGSVAALQVECGAERPATVAEYGVMVESPDGSPGRHAYYLWQLSDDPRLISRMRMLGLPAAHLADGEFTATTSADGRVEVDAQERWQGDAASLEASGTEPAAGPTATAPGVRFWFDGPRGTVRIAYECPDCRPRTPATGSVWGSPRSTLDAILGHVALGSGFFIRTDLVATARLLD